MSARTRLHTFLKTEGIGPSRLAAVSRYSRQHIYLVRTGKKQPSLQFMRAILHAASRIKHQAYRFDQLFEMDARPRTSVHRAARRTQSQRRAAV